MANHALKERLCPFNKRANIQQWCDCYGLDIEVVSKRVLDGWHYEDALLVPQNLGVVPIHIIRRTLENVKGEDFALKHFHLSKEEFDNIQNMSETYKDMFRNMKNFFFLDVENINVDELYPLWKMEVYLVKSSDSGD